MRKRGDLPGNKLSEHLPEVAMFLIFIEECHPLSSPLTPQFVKKAFNPTPKSGLPASER
jgi:hypothetical protein